MPYAVPNPLDGYRELNEAELRLMHHVKNVEKGVGELWREVVSADDTVNRDGDDQITIDYRWAQVARDHLQEGFSALLRSVARPADPFELPPTDESTDGVAPLDGPNDLDDPNDQ